MTPRRVPFLMRMVSVGTGYEKLVQDIPEVLGRAAGVEIVCWGRSCVEEGPPRREPSGRCARKFQRWLERVSDSCVLQVVETQSRDLSGERTGVYCAATLP